MSRRGPHADDRVVADHPAVTACLSAMPDHLVAGVEPLKESKKTSVFRLRMDDGAAVIAKRTWREAAERERVIYREILVNHPVDSIGFLGYAEDDDPEMAWILVEDAGDEPFDATSAEHREAAARWLARLHTSTAALAPHPALEDRGPDHYLRVLRRGRSSIEKHYCNASFSADDLRVLKEILHKQYEIEAQWPDIEHVCSRLPTTLVHGDFVGKNIRVRRDREGLSVFPFDWEVAGRGVPVTDLANISAAAYVETASDAWAGLSVEDVEVLANIGWVFRLLEWVSWARFRLKGEWASLAIERKLKYYNIWLAAALASAHWVGKASR